MKDSVLHLHHYMPEGFADNDLDLDLDCDGVLDDCQICQGNSICFGEVIDGQCNSDSNWKQKVVHLIVLAM